MSIDRQLWPRLAWSLVVVVILWVIAGAGVSYFIVDWSSRGLFGDSFGAANSLFSALAFAGIVIALLLQNNSVRLQIEEATKAHDWNRRRAAHDVVFEACLGRFFELRKQIENKINIYDLSQTSSTITLTPDDTITLDACLNFLEATCLAIKNNVVDEEIVYQALGAVLVGYGRWARPYIEMRRRELSPELWIDLSPYVEDWSARMATTKEKIEAAARSRILAGRPKL